MTISDAKESDSFEYYCKASWGATDKEVKSGNVYLAVLGITDVTSAAWGVAAMSTQFECKSDAELKKNAKGDLYLDKDDLEVPAVAQISWEYFDTTTSTWKASTADNR